MFRYKLTRIIYIYTPCVITGVRCIAGLPILYQFTRFFGTHLCLVSTESSIKLTVSVPFSPLTGFFIVAVLTPEAMFPGAVDLHCYVMQSSHFSLSPFLRLKGRHLKVLHSRLCGYVIKQF